MERKVDNALVQEICKSNRYIMIENQKEIDAYVWYITYRVQQDLFDICKESETFADVTWAQFLLVLRRYKKVRDVAVAVTHQTLFKFFQTGQYDFQKPIVRFLENDKESDDENSIMYASQLFSACEGRKIIHTLFFRGELAYYQHYLNVKRNYSWESYLTALTQDKEMWNTLVTAFKDVLIRLDFKPAWESWGLEVLMGGTQNLE